MQAIITTNAEPCKTMQKEEWVNIILTELKDNPKITNNELAEKYQVHRNRISKYRNIIRQRQLKTDMEIINKIDDELSERIKEMETSDLISYRKAVHNEVNFNGEVTTTKNVNVNVTSMLTEYDSLFKTTGTQKEPIPTNSITKQVSTPQTNPEASTIPIT